MESEQTLRALHEEALCHQRERRPKEARGVFAKTTALAIEAYGAGVRAWLFQRLGDPSAVADLFQEACASLWRALPGFRWESSLKTWFYQIAFYTLCRSLEGGKRQPKLSSASLSALALEITSLDSRLDKRNALIEALEELPEGDR